MKKFDFKSIFMGLIAGIIATCGVSIASSLVVGDVYFSSYPIYLNGKYYTSTSPVLNYNGRTYLPLNELGTALGSSVIFNNNTIYINSNNYDNSYNNNYYDDYYTETNEEYIEIEKGSSEEYYISLARYGARSATITGANSYVKVNKTRFTSSGDLKLTGSKVGDATIKITYNTGDVEKLYVDVVDDEDDEYEDEVSMEVGDTYKIYVDLDDYDADEATIKYDSDYVKVSKTKFTSDGYLTIIAKDQGETEVKIKYDSGDTEYIYIEIDNDDYDDIEVEEDDYEYVYIDLDEYDATSAEISYNSTYIRVNDTYLTESGKIKVTGKKEGYTSIKVKFNTGDIIYIDVEVTD